MAEPMAVEPSAGAPAEVTYALRVCDGVRLVIEARWHASGEAFDVQVTDGASVWRKDGVTAPKPALSAELTLEEWMGAARAALADVSYDGVSRVDAAGLLEWEWTLRSRGDLQVSNTGVAPLQPRADPEAAVFDLLCGAAQLAASAAAESARCVAAAGALREELQRTAAEAAAASAAKAASERELYKKFALVLNEKKKKISDLTTSREGVAAELDDARARLAKAEGDDGGGSDWARGGSSGDEEEDEAPSSAPQPSQRFQAAPSFTQPVPMETAKPAAVAFGRARAKIKLETQPLGFAKSAEPVASQREASGLARAKSEGSGLSRPRAAPTAALAHIQHFASLAPKDEFDTDA